MSTAAPRPTATPRSGPTIPWAWSCRMGWRRTWRCSCAARPPCTTSSAPFRSSTTRPPPASWTATTATVRSASAFPDSESRAPGAARIPLIRQLFSIPSGEGMENRSAKYIAPQQIAYFRP
ncbi:hypothetical protein CBM2631_A150080 [Cupriavidus taiwanensis]|nr:hypothetical protein CBM2588_A110079 [Cupriavidus taiwanensis]SOY80662.1 hypothetical protein CBM2591_A170041 [Cupriavidus taiwanensis]SOZ77020.1 hypothetical protein CBM2622_A140080 [Cupriavidus taiwanensis]SOZ77610.1 hypothetical protein CBM2618_A150080 [Cupriavidus taiwanensis]SOZ83179.1 hypothetical protein CBM2621_A140080 [Cupriavidus taiwanensis]